MKNSAIVIASLLLISILNATESIHAEQFFCPSGNVTCLIAAINSANGRPGKHRINLEPGTYTIQAPIDNLEGLPTINGSVEIRAVSDVAPTVIERDPNAARFHIFDVSLAGNLLLDGLTIQNGNNGGLSPFGSAIHNLGTTQIQDSVLTDNLGGFGRAIFNQGTLSVLRSIIAHSFGGHDGGAIVNRDGSVLVEDSTIFNNTAIGAGGIANFGGSLVVRNSAIIANATDRVIEGGGILNIGGSATVVNSTIAKNIAGGGGGGIANSGGFISVTNSTIRENEVFMGQGGGIGNGIFNDADGIFQLQNTIVAGNSAF